jgi:hypothetical protein
MIGAAPARAMPPTASIATSAHSALCRRPVLVRKHGSAAARARAATAMTAQKILKAESIFRPLSLAIVCSAQFPPNAQ